MEAKKLDRLFKGKLDKHVSKPSDQAWKKMEGLLGEQSSRVWPIRTVAAVTLILAASCIIIFHFSRETAITNVTELTALVPKSINQEVVRAPDPLIRIAKIKMNDVEQSGAGGGQSRTLVIENALKEQQNFNQDKNGSIQLEVSEEMIASKKTIRPQIKVTHISGKARRKPIKITYKRGVQSLPDNIAKKDTTQNGLLREMEPDQLWADFRAAKNRVIRNALNFKKEKNSNTQEK